MCPQPKHTAEERQQHLKAYKESGLPQHQYEQQHGLGKGRISYWLHDNGKYKKRKLSAPFKARVNLPPPQFTRICDKEPTIIIVETKDGNRLLVPLDGLKTVLEALK